MPTKQSSVRMTASTRAQLDKLARVTGMTQTEIIAQAIDRLAQTKYRAWVSSQANDYDPAADQDGDYKFEAWVQS